MLLTMVPAEPMIGNLDRRLARLEAVAGANAEYPVIFVSFQGPGGHEPHKATLDGRVWHRADDESGDTFQERVAHGLGTPDRLWGTVVFLDQCLGTESSSVCDWRRLQVGFLFG